MAKTKLSSELEEKIDGLMDDSNEKYDEGNYEESIAILEDAWNQLPEPKGDYSESYEIVMDICETYILLENYKKAKEWSELIFNCALFRIDSGEREFLAGKVAYESGDLEKAKEWFKIANEKSDGRCFGDSDKKYKKFFKSK